MNSRQIAILKLLLSDKYNLTVQKISLLLNFSYKTIYNDLNVIDDYLKSTTLILERKTGVGLYISGSDLDKSECSRKLDEIFQDYEPYSTTDRIQFLALILLTQNKISTQKIEEKLYVSTSTIEKDIKKLNEILKNFKIKIFKDDLYYIIGSEKNIRKALFHMMVNHKDYSPFLELIYTSNENDNIQLFTPLKIGVMLINKFKDIILLCYPNIDSFLSIEYFSQLLLNILIQFIRMNNNYTVKLSENFKRMISNLTNDNIAQSIVIEVEKHFPITYTKDEEYYLQLFILVLSDTLIGSDININKEKVLSEFIQNLASNEQYKINTNDLDQSQLLEYLNGALVRLEHGIIMKSNIITDTLKEKIPELFTLCKTSLLFLENILECKINDTEVTYISLLILNNMLDKIPKIQTIIITHYSKTITDFMVEQLRLKYSNYIKIVGITEYKHKNCDLPQNIDLILSTITLPLEETHISDKIIHVPPYILKPNEDYIYASIQNWYENHYKLIHRLI